MFNFFRDFVIYGFTSILGKIAAIFLIPIYTSILTQEEYGAMALIMSCYGIIDIVANLNIHSGIARDYYEEGVDKKKLVSTGFLAILAISVTVMMILLLFRSFCFFSILGLEEVYLMPFTIMLYSIPITSLYTYFAVLTRYKKQPILFSVGSIFSFLITIGITIYGVVVLRAGIISVFIGTSIGSLVAMLYFAYLNRDLISSSFDISYFKNALKFSIPTIPAILAGWVDNSIGQLLLGKYISLAELGVYSIAISFSSVFTLITTAFMNVWTPFLFENYKKKEFNEIIKKICIIFLLGLIAISVTLSIFSREIILLLTNPSYLDACNYLTILCIPMCFYLLFPMASSGVSISRDTKYIGISYTLGSIVNLCVLFFTINKLGAIVVPICLALSRICTYFYLYSISKKKIGYTLPNRMFLVLIIIMIGCYFLIDIQLIIATKIFIVSFVYILVYLYLRRQINLRIIFNKLVGR